MDLIRMLLLDAECKKLNCTIETFNPGDFIRSAGDEFSDLMVLRKGTVAIESVGRSGRVLEVDRFDAPELIFPCVTFSDEPVLDVDLIAATEVEILLIRRDVFFDYLWEDKERAISFFGYLGKQFSRIVRRLSDVILSDLREKVANYILQLREVQGSDEVTMPHTREELARRFGATRPSISRVFSGLSEEGIIQIRRSKVKILDFDALRAIAEGEGS